MVAKIYFYGNEVGTLEDGEHQSFILPKGVTITESGMALDREEMSRQILVTGTFEGMDIQVGRLGLNVTGNEPVLNFKHGAFSVEGGLLLVPDYHKDKER